MPFPVLFRYLPLLAFTLGYSQPQICTRKMFQQKNADLSGFFFRKHQLWPVFSGKGNFSSKHVRLVYLWGLWNVRGSFQPGHRLFWAPSVWRISIHSLAQWPGSFSSALLRSTVCMLSACCWSFLCSLSSWQERKSRARGQRKRRVNPACEWQGHHCLLQVLKWLLGFVTWDALEQQILKELLRHHSCASFWPF